MNEIKVFTGRVGTNALCDLICTIHIQEAACIHVVLGGAIVLNKRVIIAREIRIIAIATAVRILLSALVNILDQAFDGRIFGHHF